MTRHWVLMAEYDAETTTFSACAGAGGSSPYTPEVTGKIIAFKAMAGRDAATSLTDHVQFRLKCKTFGGVDCDVGVTGSGLQTAPAFPSSEEWGGVDLNIQAGVPITIEARNLTADTPVTNAVFLYALLQH